MILIWSNRVEIVRWVSENLRPFNIVNDRASQCLMKTGRPGYHIPSASTVARDVKTVFARTRKTIATMLQVQELNLMLLGADHHLLQEHEGELSFATDAWTSPNHRAFIAITVHFEHKGVPMTIILDVVEVAKVRMMFEKGPELVLKRNCTVSFGSSPCRGICRDPRSIRNIR